MGYIAEILTCLADQLVPRTTIHLAGTGSEGIPDRGPLASLSQYPFLSEGVRGYRRASPGFAAQSK